MNNENLFWGGGDVKKGQEATPSKKVEHIFLYQCYERKLRVRGDLT